jgi:Cd2+/Zn2+-exporting ATPase
VLLGLSGLLPQQLSNYFLLVVSLIGTLPIIFSTIKALRRKEITVDLLATVALSLSIIGGELLSAVFINLMVTCARILDRYTANQTRNALQKLVKLRPTEARVKRGDEFIILPLSELKKDDLVSVQLGEKIPVDGHVLSGQATVDQSSFTGESAPVEKGQSDFVFSSTIVVSGNIEVKAEKVGEETAFEHIVKMVSESEKNKAKLTSTGERFAKWYITLSFLGAIGIYLLTRNLNLILSILLVVCADDIAIAVPLAFLAGIGTAARRGIVVKGGNFLEAMAGIKNIVVDKTGTLTTGKFAVQEVVAFEGVDEAKIRELAEVACNLSTHPVSKAILQYYEMTEDKAEEGLEFKEYGGKGVVAKYNDAELIFGRMSLLSDNNINPDESTAAKIKAFSEQGFNVTALAYAGKLVALFVLADRVKDNVKASVTDLFKLGVKRIVMLTGDNDAVAERISSSVGIREYQANLLPEDKLNFLKGLIDKQKHDTAMIGDGVNDAPALTLADVGIAMGAIGSDVSVDTADIVLMDDNFAKVPEVIKLSKFIVNIGRQNFVIWAVVNVIGLAFVFGGFMNPAGAAAFNFLTDFIPISNSLRAFKTRK